MLDNKNSMRVSASKMSTYMECPMRAKFIYFDRLPEPTNSSAVFGSCVHHALEVYNKTADLSRARSTFLTDWDDPPEAIDVWTKGTDYVSLKDRGLRMIEGYYEAHRWGNREVASTEHRFVVPFGEFELTGMVDLTEIQKNRTNWELQVIDLKTSKRKPYRNNLYLNIQFTAYCYAVQQPEFWLGSRDSLPVPGGEQYWDRLNSKDLKVRPYWYHLETNQKIFAGERDDQDFMRLYRVCEMIKKSNDAGIFMPNISGDSCTFCAFTEPCQLPIPKPLPED